MGNCPVCHAGGREFESRPSRHFKSRKFKHLRLFCFHVSRQTQYPRGSRGCDAAQSQYLSHLRRNARPSQNRQNWRFVGVFSNNSPTKIQQDFEAYFRPVFSLFQRSRANIFLIRAHRDGLSAPILSK